jgi:sugar phosphate isomerase/epimerase
MKRRTCLKLACLAAGAAVARPRAILAAALNPGATVDAGQTVPLGVQLFTVREELRNDVRRTLAEIGAIGYREVELFGFGGNLFIDDPLFGLKPGEFTSALSDAGLTAPIAHISGRTEDVVEVAEFALALGVEFLVVSMAPEFLSVLDNGEVAVHGVSGREQLDRIAARLNSQGEACRKNGIGFGYHNHHMEFDSIGDERAYDYLIAQTEGDLVKLELDVGWASAAGVDPTEYVARYSDRIIACHLKDFDPALPLSDDRVRYPIPEQAQMIEPGSGKIDFPRLITALDEANVRHRFVEIDVAPRPMRSIDRAFQYLSKL